MRFSQNKFQQQVNTSLIEKILTFFQSRLVKNQCETTSILTEISLQESLNQLLSDLIQGKLQTVQKLRKSLLSLEKHSKDPTIFLRARVVLGASIFYSGELAAAEEHLKQGIALYDQQQHNSRGVIGVGVEVGVTSRLHEAVILWLNGFPSQALEMEKEGLTLAWKIAHPFTLGWALSLSAILYQFRSEIQLVQERSAKAIALSKEYGFSLWAAIATILHGWALAKQGQRKEGRDQISQGLANYRVMGANLGLPYFMSLLAEITAEEGQIEEALCLLTEAMALVDKTGECWWNAELYRLKGWLLLKQAVPSESQAEECFHRAINIAHDQQAKSLELRAVMCLSHLWGQRGRLNEARQRLAELYSHFTEGFDTADLKEARKLLEELV